MPYCVTMARASIGRHLDVRRRAGGDLLVAEDELLGDAAAHGDGDVGLQLGARVGEHVALRQAHDHAERAAARNDGRLVHRVGRLLMQGDERVPALVIGGQRLLLLGHDHGAALGAHHDLVLGVLELELGDEPLGAARGRAAPPR